MHDRNKILERTIYLKGNPGLNLPEVPSNDITTERIFIPPFSTLFPSVTPVKVSLT